MQKKYFVVGIMLMFLVAGLSGCTQQSNEEQQTEENQSPIVTISANPMTGYQPLEVSFNITASDQDGIIQSCCIDFGDGTDSCEMNPSHTYSAGTYKIVVTATDNKNATTSKNITILVKNHAPNASASANINSGTAPLEVNFTGYGNDTDGTTVSYYWEFGDGSSSDMQNPNHTFDTVGTYTVTLTVTDNDGGMATDTLTINVIESSFSLNPIADTCVCVDNPDGNYGGSDWLWVQFTEGYDPEWRDITYLKFDLSDIPISSTIKNAKLKLYCGYTSDITTAVKVHRSTDILWNEIEITTNSRPSYSSSSSDTKNVAHDEKWYEWDVKSYVQSALPTGKVTLVLDTDTNEGALTFYSKDYGVDQPVLEIELS